MSDNGTGMATPPVSEPSGAVTSREVARKNPKQGLRSGINMAPLKSGAIFI